MKPLRSTFPFQPLHILASIVMASENQFTFSISCSAAPLLFYYSISSDSLFLSRPDPRPKHSSLASSLAAQRHPVAHRSHHFVFFGITLLLLLCSLDQWIYGYNKVNG